MHSLLHSIHLCSLFFFFNDTATTEIYTLSLHDALPISLPRSDRAGEAALRLAARGVSSERRVRHDQSGGGARHARRAARDVGNALRHPARGGGHYSQLFRSLRRRTTVLSVGGPLSKAPRRLPRRAAARSSRRPDRSS